MFTGELSLNPRARLPLFAGGAMVAAYCLYLPGEPPVIFGIAGLVLGLVSGYFRAKGLRAALVEETAPADQPLEKRSQSLFLGGLLGLAMGAFLRSAQPLYAMGAGIGALLWARELLSLSAMAAWAREGVTVDLTQERSSDDEDAFADETNDSEPNEDEGDKS